MASVGSSLAGYFGVFHRLMASRLKQVRDLLCHRSWNKLVAMHRALQPLSHECGRSLWCQLAAS